MIGYSATTPAEQPRVSPAAHGFVLSGRVNFDNVVPVYRQGLELFRPQTAIEIDVSALVNEDSSVLALLCAWARDAMKEKKTIVFKHLPKSLENLVKLSGLETVFPIQS